MKWRNRTNVPTSFRNVRLAFCECAVAMVALASAMELRAGTTVAADCYTALGTPTNAQATTVCQANGCTGSFVWHPNATSIVCEYTFSTTPGTQGAWVPSDTQQTVHDCCGTTSCGSTEKTLTVSGSSTASVTGSWTGSVTTTVQAEVNTGLVSATSGLDVKNEFSLGATTSSTVDKSDSDKFTSTAPSCGKKIYYYVMFAADRPATGTLTFTLKGTCGGATCTPNPTALLTFKTGSSNLTLAGSEKARKFTECDLECPGPYPGAEGACQKSATATQTCNYNVYP
jgi:hypothetical protein